MVQCGTMQYYHLSLYYLIPWLRQLWYEVRNNIADSISIVDLSLEKIFLVLL